MPHGDCFKGDVLSQLVERSFRGTLDGALFGEVILLDDQVLRPDMVVDVPPREDENVVWAIIVGLDDNAVVQALVETILAAKEFDTIIGPDIGIGNLFRIGLFRVHSDALYERYTGEARHHHFVSVRMVVMEVSGVDKRPYGGPALGESDRRIELGEQIEKHCRSSHHTKLLE
ncbi:hypothetical protein AGR5A_Lc100023 [Agrobacterium genomosp. 5 str. CFBP 6626]|nr:hypothetical protein AGR5A_Lc100023 [Agrobacterium genomosp. 5 str. CFBP 6626]